MSRLSNRSRLHRPQPKGWNQQIVRCAGGVKCFIDGHPIQKNPNTEQGYIVSQHPRWTRCRKQIYVFTPLWGEDATLSCMVCLVESKENASGETLRDAFDVLGRYGTYDGDD